MIIFISQAAWEVKEKKPEAAWPQQGIIEFKDYQTRYREGLDLVLQGINCSVKPGEKVSAAKQMVDFVYL